MLQSDGRTVIDFAPRLFKFQKTPDTYSAMEAIGVALAVLPLLLNQLDNYVQGLESIKGFRAKRYRRELEGYFTSLGAQQTIFVNHLLRALGGVEYGDEILDLSHNGLGALWMEQSMQSSLKNKSGEASIRSLKQ